MFQIDSASSYFLYILGQTDGLVGGKTSPSSAAINNLYTYLSYMCGKSEVVTICKPYENINFENDNDTIKNKIVYTNVS